MAGAGAKQFVDDKIAQRKIILFSKSYSPECKMVKQIIDQYNLPEKDYEAVEIERRQDCVQIENYFQILCLTDTRAVPQLFVMGKYIGGVKELNILEKSGDLKKIFQTAEVI